MCWATAHRWKERSPSKDAIVSGPSFAAHNEYLLPGPDMYDENK